MKKVFLVFTAATAIVAGGASLMVTSPSGVQVGPVESPHRRSVTGTELAPVESPHKRTVNVEVGPVESPHKHA